MVIGIHHNGLALAVFINQVARDCGNLSKYQCPGHTADVNLALGICIIDAIAGQLPANVVHHLPIGKGDFEAYALQGGPAVQTAVLVERDRPLGLVAELQGYRLPRLDGGGLGHVVQDVILFCPGLAHHQRRAGVHIGDQDGARAVGDKLAIGVAQHGPVAVGDKKLAVT